MIVPKIKGFLLPVIFINKIPNFYVNYAPVEYNINFITLIPIVRIYETLLLAT